MKLKTTELTRLIFLENVIERNSPFVANQFIRLIYKKDRNLLQWAVNTSVYQMIINGSSNGIIEPHDTDVDVALSTEVFFATIKALAGDDTIVGVGSDSIKIKTGRINVKIPHIRGEELPDILKIDGAKWSKAVPQDIKVFDNLDILPNFTTADNTVYDGIVIRPDGDHIDLYASNRNMLFYTRNPFNPDPQVVASILPKEFVRAVKRIAFTGDNKLKIGDLSDSDVFVVAWFGGENNGFIHCRKLNGDPFNVERPLALDYLHKVKVDRNELIKALRLYETVTDLKSVRVRFDANSLIFDHDSIRYVLPYSDDTPTIGEPFTIATSLKQLVTICGTLTETYVTMSTSSDVPTIKFEDINLNATVIQAKMRTF